MSEKAQGLLQAAKDALGIESPSKAFRNEVGAWIPPGISEGFADAMPKAVSTMQKSLDKGLDKFDVREIDVVGLSTSFKSVVNDIADWFVSIEERLANTVDSIKADLSNLINVGQLIISPDGTISGLLVDRQNSSLDVSTPGRTAGSGAGETINNFTFYSNESIDEIQAARLLKETQRDLAEGYL